MLSRIARGVPRFSITSERLSLSTRFSSLPKLDLARRAEITKLSFAAVLAVGMNSPVRLLELYSYKSRLSMAPGGRAGLARAACLPVRQGKGGGSLPEARASRARRRPVSSTGQAVLAILAEPTWPCSLLAPCQIESQNYQL